MKKFIVLTLSVFLIVSMCSFIVSAEKIKLEFFQSKEEVVDLFDELIEKFEKKQGWSRMICQIYWQSAVTLHMVR
jgi:predicted DNA-binding protein YlxM (UPF0122 family)